MMNNTHLHYRAVAAAVLLLALAALACDAQSLSGPTDTPEPTDTPTATSTPIFTPTPSFTPTPTPTIAVPAPIDPYLSNVAVNYVDWFDTLSKAKWDCGKGSFKVFGGLLTANSNDYSGCTRLRAFQEGQGAIISFQLGNDSNLEFFFQDRLQTWNTPGYKRYGVTFDPRYGSTISNFVGSTNQGQKIPTPQPNVWYTMLLAIGKGPKFLLVLWERDNPSTPMTYTGDFPQWQNAEWQLQINSFYGEVQLDNYAEITFADMQQGNVSAQSTLPAQTSQSVKATPSAKATTPSPLATGSGTP